jgi:hypothetical protein
MANLANGRPPGVEELEAEREWRRRKRRRDQGNTD